MKVCLLITLLYFIGLYADRNPFEFYRSSSTDAVHTPDKPAPSLSHSPAELEASWQVIQENNYVLIMQDKQGNIRVVTKASS